jgi:hypothetical protein
VTPDEYRAQLRMLGLTPAKPSFNSATIHIDRDRLPHRIPDPESMTGAERKAFMDLLMIRLGITKQ